MVRRSGGCTVRRRVRRVRSHLLAAAEPGSQTTFAGPGGVGLRRAGVPVAARAPIRLMSGVTPTSGERPSMTPTADIAERKKQIREQAHANRNAQTNKAELSKVICDRFMPRPAYAAAKTVMFYIDVRAEVRTRHSLPAALASGKTIVVPWCNDRGELELFRLANMEELAIG